MDIKDTSIGSADYPKKIMNMKKTPRTIHYMGDISILDDDSMMAVIGKRQANEYQIASSRKVGKILSKKGIVVINGLAVGCDQAAIDGVLENGGKVVAVMPCGLNNLYPKNSSEYVEKIVANGGCVISTYPNDACAQKYTFIERDEIQAVLANKVFVIAAEEKSGTMHTVDFALHQGKPVGCFVDSYSSGNCLLINNKKGYGIESADGLDEFLKVPTYTQLSLF